MRFHRALACLMVLTGFASAQSQRPPDPPPSPKPQPTPRQPSAWERIQDPLDRSTGRIIDEPSYQLDRIQRTRAEDYGRIVPQTEIERFNEERERQLRIEQQQRAAQITTERQRRDELDRREYELQLRSGLSSTSLQVMQDEQSLNQAKGKRNDQLMAADKQRADALAAHPENRPQIEADYQHLVQQIHQQYESERARILGLPPATQPSP